MVEIAKAKRKPKLMNRLVSIPYWARKSAGTVSQTDLPKMIAKMQPQNPKKKRPMQMSGKLLNIVRIEAMIAIE